jgi:RNA polymerase sigma-70 factor (ECF subfamily)
MVHADDAALIKRFNKGDPLAFQDLVDQYKDLVHSVIRQTVPETSQAEDLSQEVFIRVYRGLDGFRGQSRLSSWIWRIAYRVCLSEIERIRREKGTTSIDDQEFIANPRLHPDLVDSSDTLGNLAERDQWEILFRQLPTRHRMILVLYYFQQLSYLEIAEILDRPMGTIKSDLHRAKSALRKAFLQLRSGKYDV